MIGPNLSHTDVLLPMIDVASLVRVESKTLIEKEKGIKEKKNQMQIDQAKISDKEVISSGRR